MTIAATPETIATGTWTSDPIHSSVGFAVRHMGLSPFRGGFKDFDATLAAGRLAGTARVESITTDDETLTGHLLSPDFFDAERHPELRFKADDIRREGDEVLVAGRLTLKGETRPVELRGRVTGPISDPYGNSRVGLELETTIDRTDFGIDWNAELPSGGQVLANDISLIAHLELVRQA
jgi:polyisoprenoid-binding protein YceI